MNTKELAAKLNGIEYDRHCGTKISEIGKEAKSAGIVIVYGQSDDLMEFDGTIRDEIGAWNGTTAYLTSAGLLTNDCNDEDCPHFAKLKEKAATIDAIWDPGHGMSWMYRTDIPHETFDIMEDGETYCRGIVFALADVGEAGKQPPIRTHRTDREQAAEIERKREAEGDL